MPPKHSCSIRVEDIVAELKAMRDAQSKNLEFIPVFIDPDTGLCLCTGALGSHPRLEAAPAPGQAPHEGPNISAWDAAGHSGAERAFLLVRQAEAPIYAVENPLTAGLTVTLREASVPNGDGSYARLRAKHYAVVTRRLTGARAQLVARSIVRNELTDAQSMAALRFTVPSDHVDELDDAGVALLEIALPLIVGEARGGGE